MRPRAALSQLQPSRWCCKFTSEAVKCKAAVVTVLCRVSAGCHVTAFAALSVSQCGWEHLRTCWSSRRLPVRRGERAPALGGPGSCRTAA